MIVKILHKKGEPTPKDLEKLLFPIEIKYFGYMMFIFDEKQTLDNLFSEKPEINKNEFELVEHELIKK